MSENLQTSIEGLGLKPKEAAVYLACLEFGSGTNGQIARKAKLNRITVYEILKRLEKDHYISRFKQKGVWYFSAVDPRILIDEIENRVRIARGVLPELLAVSNAIIRKPRILFFESQDGIQQIYKDSLTSRTEILTFTNPGDIEDFLGEGFVSEYVTERAHRKIIVRGLAPDTKEGTFAKKIGKQVLRETRIFPAEKFLISNEIMIYDNKIAIFSKRDEIGILIENNELYQTFKSIWEMAWQNSEKYN